MLVLVRTVLQLVLFFLLLSVLVAFASAHTGLVEKGALAVLTGLLIWSCALVRRLGAPSQLKAGRAKTVG